MTTKTFSSILHKTAKLCRVLKEDILNTRIRSKEACAARRIITHVCHELHRMSYPEIAERLYQAHSALVVNARVFRDSTEEIHNYE